MTIQTQALGAATLSEITDVGYRYQVVNRVYDIHTPAIIYVGQVKNTAVATQKFWEEIDASTC